ncbi:2-hydroxymuconate tautomerase [Kribbella sp. CA-293567]|uniref:2-hydroxymuconate tautomerase n=1 Tax=Kribbella sp. CA-293567 TaxID=3002436 RepID=UPI0022DE45AE|nr:2-hydroxymuconate tautomerase [Kribbella sp. CA-293567]WBQ04426.1 4-oxalocrotonate tautomerase family protein [Kribbella sp. CA-293567]
MPMITVQLFAGRNAEQKVALAERLTDAFLETCGRPDQPQESVWVVIDEVAREHWAVGGRLGAATGDESVAESAMRNEHARRRLPAVT